MVRFLMYCVAALPVLVHGQSDAKLLDRGRMLRTKVLRTIVLRTIVLRTVVLRTIVLLGRFFRPHELAVTLLDTVVVGVFFAILAGIIRVNLVGRSFNLISVVGLIAKRANGGTCDLAVSN